MAKINIGDRFSKLTVINKLYKTSPSGRKRLHYICLCDCGKEHNVDCGNLANNNTKACPSCAAKARSAHRKKPHRKHRVRNVYFTMIARCKNKNNKSYKSYGGKGVKVCDRWLDSLDNFVEDMGLPKDGQSIDRINVHGNYEPSNCRWVSAVTQANNKANTKRYLYRGELLTMAQWARRLNIPYDRLKNRLKVQGLDFDKAVSNQSMLIKSRYVTPDGEFDTIKECAEFYMMSESGVSGRFNSKSYQDWVKEKVL